MFGSWKPNIMAHAFKMRKDGGNGENNNWM